MPNRDTKLVLLETAERLFAEQGIEGVSLRQITVAAKQKNTSALHYHFGSRQNVIEAILALRVVPINEARLRILADLQETGHSHDLRALVAVRVGPLAERLITSEGPDYFIRFLAHCHLSPHVDILAIARDRFDEGLVRTGRLIHQTLSDVPTNVLDRRLALSVPQMSYALAGWQTLMLQSGAELTAARLCGFTNNLIDYLAGALSAPVSAQSAGAAESAVESSSSALLRSSVLAAGTGAT